MLIRDTFSNYFLKKAVVVGQSESNIIFRSTLHGIFHAERGRETLRFGGGTKKGRYFSKREEDWGPT